MSEANTMQQSYKTIFQSYRDALEREVESQKEIAKQNSDIFARLSIVGSDIIMKNEQLEKKQKHLTDTLRQLANITYEETKQTLGEEIRQLEEEIEFLRGELSSLLSHRKEIEGEKIRNQNITEQLHQATQNEKKRLKKCSEDLVNLAVKIKNFAELTSTLSFREALVGCSRSDADFRCYRFPEYFDEKEKKLYQDLADGLNLSICLIETLNKGVSYEIKVIFDPVKKISNKPHEYVYILIDDMGNFLKPITQT